MDPFLKKFFPTVYHRKHNKISQYSHYCKYNNQGLVVLTSSLYVAGLVAFMFASHVTWRYGCNVSSLNGGDIGARPVL